MNDLHCTFLFSDAAEWELFVAKILSEKNLVQKWFVVNGAYSFKGEYIGLCAKNLLANEPRLKPYGSRIEIIENETNYFNHSRRRKSISLVDIFRYLRNRAHQRVIQKEKAFFSVEKWTRDLATTSILNQTDNSDWLLISDVDEILDTSGTRGEYIGEKLNSTSAKSVRVLQLRYVFDFDNLAPQVKLCPIVKISLLRGEESSKISEFRFRQEGQILSAKPLIFEYSYCFSIEAIRRKLQNFAHVGPVEDVFSAALRLNHHFIQPGFSTTNRLWLKKYELDVDCHAAYVINNFNELRTGNINPDYEIARINEFPQMFSKRIESSS